MSSPCMQIQTACAWPAGGDKGRELNRHTENYRGEGGEERKKRKYRSQANPDKSLIGALICLRTTTAVRSHGGEAVGVKLSVWADELLLTGGNAAPQANSTRNGLQ